ncbi:MAG: gliding motility protein GldC [Trueperaceae bacterium]|nr:gliding motility protein GldC [Trueperaceae bacterium]
MTRSDIRLSVTNDDDGVRDIRWEADDAPEPGEQRATAMLLSLWDADARNALRIDLWTQDMTVEDMNDFFFQTLLTLADTYKNATGDADLMSDVKAFARTFAEKASDRERARGGGA